MVKTKIIILTSLFYLFSDGLLAQTQPAAAQVFITFRVDVDKLRVRAAADKNAPVVAELPEHTQLRYLDETSGNWENITLRDQAHKARWYKVEQVDNESVAGWVYGGAVALSSVYIGGATIIPAVKYDFLELRKVTKTEYDAVAKKYISPVVWDTLQHQVNDSTIMLTFDNGKKKILHSTPPSQRNDDKDDIVVHEYLGQIPAAHVYMVETTYYEDSEFCFYNIANGNALIANGFSEEMPVLSKNNQWLAMGWSNGYEDIGGIQIFKNNPTGLSESALLTFEHIFCEGSYWDSNGNLFFSSYEWAGESKIFQYFCLRIPQL